MTNIEGYSESVILQKLFNENDSAILDNLETSLINNKQLIDDTSSLLNNIGTDPKSMIKLKAEQKRLESSLSSMLNTRTSLMNQKIDLQNREVLIGGKNASLETWIQNHPFEMWNYANKINKLEVHYTNFGIMGIRILYRRQGDFAIVGVVTSTDNSIATSIEIVNFPDDEWLVQIQITNSSTDTIGSTLCKSISFYTSKNPVGTPPKITIPASSTTNVMNNKKFYVDGTARTWLQHKTNAETQGATLACFETREEIEKMLTGLGNDRYKYGSFYIGLYHPNALITNNNFGGGKPYNVASNKSSNWKWVDNTPYNPNTTNWNGGEPNNWGPGENVAQMYSNGRINDLTKTNRLSAIYQKKIVNTESQIIRKNGQHITYFNIKPLSGTYDSITSPDILQKNNAESAVKNTKESVAQLDKSAKTLDRSLEDVNNAIARITPSIDHIKRKINLHNQLNAEGEKYLKKNANIAPFTNISDKLFSGYMLNTMKEGFKEGSANQEGNGLQDASELLAQATATYTGEVLNDINSLRTTENNKAVNEYIIKKDNIFTNILTDHMLNDKKDSVIGDVYNKIDQQNKDKMRKIEINTYYDKAYKEYTNILIIIIFACILLVPIVIANKKAMLPNNITNILVVVIIFITIILISTKFIDIYTRDNKDFDKIDIPYDREAALLQKSGTITKKRNLLSSFSLTCIGADCCPDPSSGMVFDPVKNRCVASETYTDYFNEPVGNYLDETLNGYLDVLLGKSNQSSSYSLVQPFSLMTKEKMIGSSLNESTADVMTRLSKKKILDKNI